MSNTLVVIWTISSTTSPALLLYCSRCDRQRRFVSSGRFRLNANGRKLDAWLVYRCDTCDHRWNRPLFERRSANEIEPALMDALRQNDPVVAERTALDLSGTGLQAVRSAVTVERRVLPPVPHEPQRLVIHIATATRFCARADRLIAQGLGLSRGAIEALAASGRLTIADAGTKALSRTLRDGMTVQVDLSRRADAREIAIRAANG